MTLRLIPNVYQMMFMKKYAKKQVDSLYKKKSEQLRESAIGINELFTKKLGVLSDKFIQIGEERQKIVDMFGIKPAQIIVYYYKNVSTEENKNYAKVLFLNSIAELWNFVKGEKFIKKNENNYYIKDNLTLKQFAELKSAESHNKTYAFELIEDFHNKSGPLITDKQKRLTFSVLMKNMDEFYYYFNLTKKVVDHPLNINSKCEYIRLEKKTMGEFIDIFISLPDEQQAVPKESITIKNVNKEVMLSPALYDREYQEKLDDLKRGTAIKSYIVDFLKEFNKVLKALDVDLKDTSLIYTERKVPKGMKVKIQSAKTAKFFKEAEKKKNVISKLEERLRWFIYREWDKQTEKKLTLLETSQVVINDLRKYKDIISRRDTESIFSKITEELERGDTWTKNPLANSIIVNASKKITLDIEGREILEENIGFLFRGEEKEEVNEKPVNLLEGARVIGDINEKPKEVITNNNLFGEILDLNNLHEMDAINILKDQIIKKIDDKWEIEKKNEKTFDLGQFKFRKREIKKIWKKYKDNKTAFELIVIKGALYDVCKYFGLTVFLGKSKIFKETN